ncbi:cuticle protein 16.5-like [Anoplophora glabripennis]|uniref:cuticle protein 16.5-like n=1 Tax=Anoplophora glabripennis TaxID=217634 RepID=UPI0008735AF0|nr:cuticle protein 16.5-like [Anoplophora glabripennis]
MKFLVFIVAVWAVASAEDKKEKRGLLGLGYGHGAIAEPLSYGYGPSLPLAGHGIALSAPISAPLVKTISAPLAYSAPAVSYSAPAISYSAPAISYSAPLLAKSYAAPIAAPVAAPLFAKSIAAPISYSAPLITKSYAAPAYLSSPVIKSYAAPAIAAPISLGHGLGYSDLSLGLGYGKYLH